MFTGLIEEVGSVEAVRHGAGPSRLVIRAPHVSEGAATGDSISVNGVCLTVVACAGSRLEFDAVAETLRRSTLGELRPGEPVNLERAMPAAGRFGGHFVQGHVDGVGRIAGVVPEAAGHRVTVAAPAGIMRYVVEKGSIAVDGISLTVAGLSGSSFDVAIIPHTWAQTTLGNRRRGDRVNLEVDLLAKYLERLLEARAGTARHERQGPAAVESPGLTEAALREHGFA